MMLSDRIIFANERSEFDILGKDGQDNFVFKKIKQIDVVEKNTFQILTEQKIFQFPEHYVIYGTLKPLNIKNLKVNELVFNIRDLSYNDIKNQFNINKIDSNTVKSYLYGFHNSILTKLLKFNLIFTLKTSYNSNIQFLDIVNDNYLKFSQQINDSLLEDIIKWHFKNNIPLQISEIFGNYYRDCTHISKGIVRCSIPISRLSNFQLDMLSSKKLFLPFFIFHYSNLKYFLIGFMLGMMWNGELYHYNGDKGLTWRNGKGDSINTTKNISFIIPQNNILLKFLSSIFSIFNFQYKYELNKKNNFVKITLPTNNFRKLLGETAYGDQIYSKIINIEKKESTKMLKFEVETDESGWRPILDHTLVEID